MATSTLYILLIEDNDGDARLLQEHLRDAQAEDVQIDHVKQLKDGLARLADRQYDLVLLDLSLPDAKGMGTFERLHQAYGDVPIVVLTGMEDDSMALQAVREGAQDYLVKGKVDGPRLVQAMRYAVERQRLLERTRSGSDADASRQTSTQVVRETSPIDNQSVAGYRLKRIVGEGSMATVYLAEKTSGDDDTQYALKVMKLDSISHHNQKSLLERFFREAEVAASVRHPNVVEIIEFGTANEQTSPYIVMELVTGSTLQQTYRDRDQFDIVEKTHILRQVASALAAIHRRKICHRDVKPSNIIIDDGLNVKMTDFGIALVPGSDLTIDLHLIGSPAYMAPEAFRSPKISPLADIFSLGIVAYELFLGRRPFEGETIAQLATQIQHERPIEPRKLKGDFPPFLQNILARLLKKEPSQRYGSTDEVVEDLETFLQSKPFPPAQLLESFRQRLWRSDWK